MVFSPGLQQTGRGKFMNEEFVGTMPVQERHRFDVVSLEGYLREHVAGFSGNLEVEQFKGVSPIPLSG